MTERDIVREVARHGASLSVVDGRLRVQTPAPLPSELSAAIRTRRAALAALLQGRSPVITDTPMCPTCGARPVPAGKPIYARCEVCVVAAWLVIEQGRPPYIVTDKDIDDALQQR